MGLFDFFRRKPKSPPPPVLPDRDEPRCCHYTLAHVALRHLALNSPLEFLGILSSDDARPFLARLLARVSEDCRDREDRPDFSAADLTVHPVRAGRFPCAVIQMPPPRATGEAHFVAAVLLADLSGGVPEGAEVQARYFTLEKGFELEGGERTVLCEWTAHTHSNFGDGPEPRVEAFVRAIARHLSADEGG